MPRTARVAVVVLAFAILVSDLARSQGGICTDFSGGPFVGPGLPQGNVQTQVNCLNFLACHPAEQLGISYETPNCDPSAGPCTARVTASLLLEGTSRNISQSPQPWTILDWSLGSSAIGTCGQLGALIRQDLFDTWLEVPGFSCSNPQGTQFRGTYSLRATTCFTVSGCQRVETFEVPVTAEALEVALCSRPPQVDCDDCKSCPLGGSSGPGGAGGGGAEPGKGSGGSGGAGVNSQGGGPATTPPQGGPGALLHYHAGGVGHPGFPGSPAWNTGLGRYWSHDLAERIVRDELQAGRVWLLTRTGSFRSFTDTTPDGEGLYEESTPSNEYRKLFSAGAGWELHYLDGTVTSFDAEGRWLANVDRNGNTLAGTYAGGRLVSVSFPDGRGETLGYHPSGKLASITEVGVGAAQSRTWLYAWSGDNLVRIDRPDGTAWILEYGDPAHPGYLTAMKLEGRDGGIRVERAWEYDARGNVVFTWRGDASRTGPDATELWQFEYDDPLRPARTTVTDPLGEVTVYVLDWSDPDHARIGSIQGTCPGCGFGGDATLLYDDPAHPLLPTEIQDGNGNRKAYTYDENGQRRSLTEALGEAGQRTSVWEYDSNFPAFVSRLERPGVAPGVARVASWVYDPSTGDLESETLEGYEATYEGGPELSLTSVFQYDPSLSGALASSDPPGYGGDDRTTWTYDSERGNLVPFTRSDPLIGLTVFEHDVFNRQTAAIDPNGTRAETAYDTLDRTTETRVCNVPVPSQPCDGSNDLVTGSEYTEFGDLERTILPRGNVIEYRYDSTGRLLEIGRQPDRITPGERTVYTLDEAGNRVLESLERWDGIAWVVDSMTETVYESRCQVKKTILGKGSARESVTEFRYDCNGNLKHLWDANHPASGSASTEYDYDPLDRLETVTRPWGGVGGGSVVTSYRYDAQDHLIRVTDGEGGVTIYEYSDRDLLSGETSEVTGVTSHRYNEHGELVESTDARGVTVMREADELDRVQAVHYPDGALDVSYAYDDPAVPFSLGRLTRISRGDTRVDYGYDPFGRLNRDGTLEYRYDANGNRRQIVYPGGVVATYAYDFADRPQTLDLSWPEGRGTQAASLVTDAEYLALGPLRTLLLGNDLVEDRAYDERYYPDRIELRGGAQPISSWVYTVDDVGNVLSIDDGAAPRIYGYQDYQYFLTQGAGPWGTLAWTYDRIGNRLSEDRDGAGPASYVHLPNAAGGNTSLLATVGGTKSYTFGPAGHLEAVNAAGNLIHFVHDDEGRLSDISRELGDTAEIVYDGRGFLARASSRPTSRIFADGFESGDLACWDSFTGGGRGTGDCDLPQPRSLEAVYSSDGLLHSVLEVEPAPAHRHVLYLAGRPIAVLTLDEPVQLQYLTTDYLGTPMLATDASATLEWSGGFEPFGRDWLEGTSSGALESSVFLRFPGQWEHKVWLNASLGSALLYNLHRWYEPHTGRYSRPDPLRSNPYFVASSLGSDRSIDMLDSLSASTFAYAASSPLVFTDPLGLVICEGQWRRYTWWLLGDPPSADPPRSQPPPRGLPLANRIPNAPGPNPVRPPGGRPFSIIPPGLCFCAWLCKPCEGAVLFDPRQLPVTRGLSIHTGRSVTSGDACLCSPPGPETGCTFECPWPQIELPDRSGWPFK